MIDLSKLNVSLTKNGYLKIADLLKEVPPWEILNNCEGTFAGINIKPGQVAKILSADRKTGIAPDFWGEICEHGSDAIDCFTMVAIIFSHAKLIELFQASAQGAYLGSFSRDDLTEKEFTNLVYALATLRLCPYDRGAPRITYDFRPLVHALRTAGPVVRKLISLKLRQCGWIDPAVFRMSSDGDFLTECQHHNLHQVFSMEPDAFQRWMSGDFHDMDEYTPRQRPMLPSRPR